MSSSNCGPAGPLPGGLQLLVHDGPNVIALSLGGVIPDDGDGTGFFVLGDPGVKHVDQVAPFSIGGDDLPDLDPSAVQLFDPSTDCVYDSVVYEAFGGLDDLARRERRGVTSNGAPWLGEIAAGTDANGHAYSAGRYPDGANQHVNALDFAFQPSSPGVANGGSIVPPLSLDFSTPPARAFQTFQSFAVTDPVSAGLPGASNGGRAYRCVDTSGGGVIGVVGDAALGALEPYRVRGELYLPTSADAAQAVAVGFCGRSGSRFFTSTLQDRSAYESGYWLIYENQPGVGLADGRADHPGVFELVHATHDNQDGEPVAFLGAATLAETGAFEGTWTTFELALESGELRALINGVDVWRGPAPAGGPTSGAVQIGFRENHAGPPGPAEGTWVDGLQIDFTDAERTDGELLPVR